MSDNIDRTDFEDWLDWEWDDLSLEEKAERLFGGVLDAETEYLNSDWYRDYLSELN